jgi:transposase InsO family protein
MSMKLEFAERATQPGAKLAALCRDFGITRPTGRKWRKRYLELGAAGLEEESRRPKSSPLSLAEDLVSAVLQAREAHPSWGPKKLHQLLRRRFADATPSRSTVARLLHRFGRIERRRPRPPVNVVEKAPSVNATKPNAVWTVDFKGWWKSHDGNRCEPLTVRDAYSRFVLSATLTRTSAEQVRPIFEALFRKHGLPEAIQCDNGCPFIHVRARAGLSRLSAWWVSLGIRIIRSRPGCPQDNGGHERMHRDIAREIESSPALTIAIQQRVLDKWRQQFNHVRPHDRLDGKTPAEVYRNSDRRFEGPRPALYPPHFLVRPVFGNGTMSLNGDKYFISESLAGHDIGLEQLDVMKWKVWFHHIDCGELEVLPEWIDEMVAQRKLRPARARRNESLQRASG